MINVLADSQAPLLWRNGVAISRAEFLQRALKLARSLPTAAYYFNLCQGRDNFMLAMAAGLIANKTALLPSSKAPELLEDLATEYQTALVLSDTAEAAPANAKVMQVGESWNDAWLGGGECAEATAVPRHQLAVIPFTSGSTGRPSAHPKRWADLVCENTMACERLFATSDSPALSIVATVPPQHMYGLETTVLTALHGNCQVHAGRPLLPSEVAAALAEMPEPRVLVSTPAHLRVLLGAAQRYPSIQKVVSATAPLPSAMAAQIEAAWQTEVHEIYGCTEAGSLASRRTTTGPMWLPYEEMTLFNQDQQCWVTGPQLLAAVPLNDSIDLMSDGRFVLRGRNSDMVNVAGKRASLADITQKLLSVEGVDDAVVWQPSGDDVTGRLAAVVVAPSLNQRQLRAALRRKLDPVFLPRPLRFVAQLPRNETGKLPKQVLETLLTSTRTRTSTKAYGAKP